MIVIGPLCIVRGKSVLVIGDSPKKKI